MAIDIGQTYRAVLAVADEHGNPVNPATASLTVTTPDQATHAVTVTLPPADTGILLGDYPTVQEGLHRFAWQTTDPGTASVDWENVRAYRSIFSLADARQHLGLYSDTRFDQHLRAIMAAATRIVERYVGTCVTRTIAGEFHGGTTKDVIQVLRGPVASAAGVTSVTSVWNGGPSWSQANGDFIVNPYAGTIRLGSRLPFWDGPWLVTYTAGRAVIAEDTVLGGLEVLYDLWADQRGNGTDQQEPSYEEIAQAEANYRPSGRAMELLGGECRPGFG